MRNPSIGGRTSWVADHRGSWVIAGIVAFFIPFVIMPDSVYQGHEEVVIGALSANPLARTIKLGVLGVSTLIVLWRAKLAYLLLCRTNPFFLLFIALVPASVLWSIEPGATIARFISMVSMVQMCLAFVLVGWHRTRYQSVVRPILTALLVGSIVYAIVAPDLAIEKGEGTLKDAWRGLTSQKNEFGVLASFGVVFWLHAWLSREVKPLIALAGLGLSFVCVLLSRSSTSLLASALATVFMLMLLRSPKNLGRYMPYIVGSFAGLVLLYAVAVLKLVPGLDILLTPITSFTGKDLTFSNRSEIWVIIKDHLQGAPLLGTGYGAYWIGAVPTSPSYVFLRLMYFYPAESHNGYLEIVNDLGFVGLAVLVGYLIVFVRQALRLMRVERTQGALYLSLFFQQAISNLSATTWLAVNAAFVFSLMTLATFSMARGLLEEQLRRYFPDR